MSNSKKEMAVAFIEFVRASGGDELSKLISEEAGEELARFFLAYSANLINKDPSRILENTSSLMLMGYLIRMNEERNGIPMQVPQEFLH